MKPTLNTFLKQALVCIGIANGIVSIIVCTVVLIILDDFMVFNSERFFYITTGIWFGGFLPLIFNYEKIEKKLRRYYRRKMYLEKD